MTHEFDENEKLRPVSIDGNFGDTLPMGSVTRIIAKYYLLKLPK